jgi:hypothetical protein
LWLVAMVGAPVRVDQGASVNANLPLARFPEAKAPRRLAIRDLCQPRLGSVRNPNGKDPG